MSRNIKFAIAQISTDPGNISANAEKIIKNIREARNNGAKIVIFPELAIPGYMSLDLMLYPKFIEENLKALKDITNNTEDILTIIGFIDQDKNKIGPDDTPVRYNSAAVIYNNKLVAILDKTLLPNYDVFFEDRYFNERRGQKLINFQGINLGIQICEDLWDENYPIKVSQDLIKKGADILINISGSPFYVGKRFEREKLVEKVSPVHGVPFLYANTVGVQDGYDGELVFDGQSMVFNNLGKLVALGKKFAEELIYINYEDLFNGKNEFKLPDYNPTEEIFEALVLAIKDYFRRTGFKKAFIGLSGGIDSALVATLAVRALGSENITALYMPSPFSSKASFNDSEKLAKNLGIRLEVIPLDGLYNNFLTTLEKSFTKLPFDTTEENLQARIRGMILMAHANKFNGLVISTANKTETALGYTTLYGDMCGAIAPLADVSKLKVYDLANFINSNTKDLIPENVIKKIPTAELREGQTDEGSLGAPYSIISPLVDEIVENGKTLNELSKKYPKEIVKYIFKLINQNEYKRRQAAPGVKITKKAFGLGRRIPIAHNFTN